MKRRLTKLVVFLLLGAIVNVAVAWGCVAAFQNFDREVFLDPPISWPRDVPARWPAPREGMRAYAMGYRYLGTKGSARLAYDGSRRVITPEDIRSGWNQGQEYERGFELYMIDLYIAGWPCGTLRSEMWDEAKFVGEEGSPFDMTLRHDGHAPQTAWIRGAAYPETWPGFDGDWKRIPLLPIWPGFVINTIFYAAILWLLTLGPFTARRMIRRKRGHCIKCGYDLRGTSGAVCPECGKELCEEVTR